MIPQMAVSSGREDFSTMPISLSLTNLNKLENIKGKEIDLDLDSMTGGFDDNVFDPEIMTAVDRALCSEADGHNKQDDFCFCQPSDFNNANKPHCKKGF